MSLGFVPVGVVQTAHKDDILLSSTIVHTLNV